MADRPAPQPANRKHQVRLVVAGICVVVVLLFAFQNRGEVKVDYLFFDRESRLIYVILASAILGAIAGALFRRARRRGDRDD
jgi:uncharacterized integral membrane protein